MSSYISATGTWVVITGIYFGNPVRTYSDIVTGCTYSYWEH